MPIYEYLCSKCGNTFEKIEKFSDQPLKTHEDCGGPVERLVSAPAFQFKGTGWYVTDYAKGSAPGLAGAKPKEGGAASEAKSESKSESKPDAKESKSTSTETKTAATPAATPASSTSK
jgi:putative FmdB family regulatory protein